MKSSGFHFVMLDKHGGTYQTEECQVNIYVLSHVEPCSDRV